MVNTKLFLFFQEISSDLKKDFPEIESIERENNSVIITGCDDVLWNIFEVLFNGVKNIEFNMDKNKTHYLIIDF